MSPVDTIKIKDYSGKYVSSVHFRHAHQWILFALRKGYMADEKYAIHKFDLAEFPTVSFMMIGPNNDSRAAVARRTSGNMIMPLRWKPCSLESGPLSTRYSTVTRPDIALCSPKPSFCWLIPHCKDTKRPTKIEVSFGSRLRRSWGQRRQIPAQTSTPKMIYELFICTTAEIEAVLNCDHF